MESSEDPGPPKGPIRWQNAAGTVGGTVYPIGGDDIYNLKGRMFTLIDATFIDPQQRKAQKDIVWQAIQAWFSDRCESRRVNQ